MEIVRRLVARSDVVHHNMVKGVAGRLGIDYETLRKIKPDIIYCNTYMYGPEGPLSHLGGNDSLSQALSGLEWEPGAGGGGQRPLYYRIGHTDTTNALASVVGVLLALAHRDRTGEGQEVWTSLLNAAVYVKVGRVSHRGRRVEPAKLNKSQTGFGPCTACMRRRTVGSRWRGSRTQHWPRVLPGAWVVPSSSTTSGSPAPKPGRPTASSSRRCSSRCS